MNNRRYAHAIRMFNHEQPRAQAPIEMAVNIDRWDLVIQIAHANQDAHIQENRKAPEEPKPHLDSASEAQQLCEQKIRL